MSEQPRLNTFWFSDIEGSTKLVAEVGDSAFRELLREHRAIVRAAFAEYGGQEVGTEGDSFFATFPSPAAAASAAQVVCSEFDGGPIRVRIGIHAGLSVVEEGGHVGLDVHRAARIAGVAHGGQILLSDTAKAHFEGGVVDLGEHRLKDLSATLRLFQLGERSFPPLRSLHRTNLPVPPTPFLGREDALEAVATLLGRGDVRLVTLTGPGGMGKTRLALQAAADAADEFADGVWWIPLAQLADPALILSTVAHTLQIGAAGGEAVATALTDRLSGRSVLVVIDNAEHLLPDVAGAVAHLAAIDGPRLCVTSRERLALPGEHVFTVPALSESDSVALFVARARQLDPAFTEVPGLSALCRQLDNLPLAIELAAARSTLFSVDELAERLGQSLGLLKAGRGSEERHETLRAAIDWSYRLLGAEEQRVYRACATFRGGCTVDALEQIAGTDPDAIGSLLDKSLLSRRDGEGGPRLFMLELVRRHAAELLADDPERGGLAAASARYFTDLTEQAFARVTSFAADNARWWGVMRDERDNVRAALAFHDAAGDAQSLARICAGEWFLWFFIGDPVEGAEWLRRALELGPPRHLLSPVENAYAAVLMVSGEQAASAELAASTQLAGAALRHAREIRDRRAESAALITLGNGLTSGGPDSRAAGFAAWTDGASAARAAGEDWWEACALANLAEWALRLGDREEAVRLCDELSRLEGGRPNVIINTDLLRADIAWIDGDVGHAREQVLRVLEQQQHGTLFAVRENGLVLAARIVAGEGRLEDAALLMAAATAREADFGLALPAAWNEPGNALAARIANDLGPDRSAAARVRGRQLSLGETITYAIELLSGERAS
ncbi:MAG: adenylate/guanylate cyclase domain-containing protein [Actinomycetota bacterium]|nr:adenylate/guanylate cyclase domain-containing protein [Actinomycetota bacterium]